MSTAAKNTCAVADIRNPVEALALADRAQAICDAQLGAGNGCCLMREVADALRALAARAPEPSERPIVTVNGDGEATAVTWQGEKVWTCGKLSAPFLRKALDECRAELAALKSPPEPEVQQRGPNKIYWRGQTWLAESPWQSLTKSENLRESVDRVRQELKDEGISLTGSSGDA